MSASYRDENESLRARNAQLEAELIEREVRLEALEQKLGDNDAVLDRLRGIVDQRSPKAGRFTSFACGVLLTVAAVGAVGGVVTVVGARRASAAAPPAQNAPSAAPDRLPPVLVRDSHPPIDDKNLCARLGIRVTVDGEDAEAPAKSDADGSGTKYRRNGDRATYFSVGGWTRGADGGNLYVHAWGSDMPGDVGTSKLTLFEIKTKGEPGGYALARDGRSVLEVLGHDGKNAWGRFEADMSRVPDVTRAPPFGTPVVRVRGNFCLPFRPGDPKDTGP